MTQLKEIFNPMSDETHPDEFMAAHRGEHHHHSHRPNQGRMTDWEKMRVAAWETMHDHTNPLVQFGHRVIQGGVVGTVLGAFYTANKDSLRYSSHFNERRLHNMEKKNVALWGKYYVRHAGRFAALGVGVNLFHWLFHDKFLVHILGIHSLPVALGTYLAAYSVHMNGFKFLRFYFVFGGILGAHMSKLRYQNEWKGTPGRVFWVSDVTEEEKEQAKQRMMVNHMSHDAKRLYSQDWLRV